MTERLYYEDPELYEFEATVVRRSVDEQGVVLILDRTAFYPEGGGQPADAGDIDGLEVLDVTSGSGSEVLHWITRGQSVPEAGSRVVGRVDAERRIDHSQQHSAQHILTQALIRVHGWETVGFHLGSETSTVDLDTPDASWPRLLQAEKMANRVVLQNLPCHITVWESEVDVPSELRGKLSDEDADLEKYGDGLRVVSFGDFDSVPCGGTHVMVTGGIGLIKLLFTERVRGRVRLHFAAGNRAVVWFERHRAVTEQLCARLTTGLCDLVTAVDRILNDNRAAARTNRRLRSEMSIFHARDLLNRATELPGGLKLVRTVYEGDRSHLNYLIDRLTADGRVLALLAAVQGDQSQFVFARSPQVQIDCSRVLQEVVNRHGGGGGGSPQRAQGGGVAAEQVREVLDEATRMVRGLSEQPRNR